jgi:hypothetical protein
MYLYPELLSVRLRLHVLGLPYSVAIDMWSLGWILGWNAYWRSCSFFGSDQFIRCKSKGTGMFLKNMLGKASNQIKT